MATARTPQAKRGTAPGGKADGAGRAAGEILIEFQQVGNAVKVTAIDPVTLVEATIVGPPSAGEEALKRAAVDKLAYVQRAKRAPGR